jgi:hypothetical protein
VKLTIKDVAKMSGLAESSVRQYAWERGIGRIVGRTKYFTPSEARKLSAKRSKTSSRKTQAEGPKIEPEQVVSGRQAVVRKRSVWSFLGFGEAKSKVGIR